MELVGTFIEAKTNGEQELLPESEREQQEDILNELQSYFVREVCLNLFCCRSWSLWFFFS